MSQRCRTAGKATSLMGRSDFRSQGRHWHGRTGKRRTATGAGWRHEPAIQDAARPPLAWRIVSHAVRFHYGFGSSPRVAGPLLADRDRVLRGYPAPVSHGPIDEEVPNLWRAVDQHGIVLDILGQSFCNAACNTSRATSSPTAWAATARRGATPCPTPAPARPPPRQPGRNLAPADRAARAADAAVRSPGRSGRAPRAAA